MPPALANRPSHRPGRPARKASALLLATLALAFGVFTPETRGALIFTNLVSFAGTNGDSPHGTLVQGRDGALYGVTFYGGISNSGTVFKLSLDGALTTLTSFVGTNGANPYAGLVQGNDGNFYGTTQNGGQFQKGTVFKITPAGLLTTLVSFDFTNGASPRAELVQGTDGSFYGTTFEGGPNPAPLSSTAGCGTAFRVTPDGTLSPLVSFDSVGTDGFAPWSPLAQGADGCFYGTTTAGGVFTNMLGVGYGTLFQLTPAGTLTTLASYDNTNEVSSPFGLLQGSDGNLYGTSYGGAYCDIFGLHFGNVFRLTPAGVLTPLVSFNGTNGSTPRSLMQATDGNFYGLTGAGGIGYDGKSYDGYGTVFRVTPGGALTTLFTFNGINGYTPFGGLLQARDGNFYGTTMGGGTLGHGNLFRLSVPMAPVCQPMNFASNAVSLSWSAVAGQKYQVQFASEMSQTNWTNAGSPVIATDGTATFPDANEPGAQRFYRVVLLP